MGVSATFHDRNEIRAKSDRQCQGALRGGKALKADYLAELHVSRREGGVAR